MEIQVRDTSFSPSSVDQMGSRNSEAGIYVLIVKVDHMLTMQKRFYKDKAVIIFAMQNSVNNYGYISK